MESISPQQRQILRPWETPPGAKKRASTAIDDAIARFRADQGGIIKRVKVTDRVPGEEPAIGMTGDWSSGARNLLIRAFNLKEGMEVKHLTLGPVTIHRIKADGRMIFMRGKEILSGWRTPLEFILNGRRGAEWVGWTPGEFLLGSRKIIENLRAGGIDISE